MANLRLVHAHGEGRQAEAVRPFCRALQRGVGAGGRGTGGVLARELQEGAANVHARVVGVVHVGLLPRLDRGGKELAGRVAGEDVQSGGDALELLRAELAPRDPVGVLRRASFLGLIEELDVGLHLCLRVFVQLGPLGEVCFSFGLLALLLGLQGLHFVQRPDLLRDHLLELPVLAGLGRSRALEVGGEGLVHVPQDALHRYGLRRVVGGAACRADQLAQHCHLRGLDDRRCRQRGHDRLERCVGLRALLQEGGQLGALLEDDDGPLQGVEHLLHLRGLRHVGAVLLLPEARQLRLCVLVFLDLLHQLLNL
mmetsp:Transcript_16017/g.44063  ORF Transcript_16017/g.44063 Transcript_16017/m.44063 type:complete len:311 (+) Transcript_16017:1053-1985(+)